MITEEMYKVRTNFNIFIKNEFPFETWKFWIWYSYRYWNWAGFL